MASLRRNISIDVSALGQEVKTQKNLKSQPHCYFLNVVVNSVGARNFSENVCAFSRRESTQGEK